MDSGRNRLLVLGKDPTVGEQVLYINTSTNAISDTVNLSDYWSTSAALKKIYLDPNSTALSNLGTEGVGIILHQSNSDTIVTKLVIANKTYSNSKLTLKGDDVE
jgi:hypothetical protein